MCRDKKKITAAASATSPMSLVSQKQVCRSIKLWCVSIWMIVMSVIPLCRISSPSHRWSLHIKYQRFWTRKKNRFITKSTRKKIAINHVLFVVLFIWCRKNTSIVYFMCIRCCCLFQLPKITLNVTKTG